MLPALSLLLPCKNYPISQAFYSEIGFIAEPVSKDLTLISNGQSSFFLQRFYRQELAENFMLQICVVDINEAYELCRRSKFKTKISEISDEAWGRVFYLWGPSDELLHITELANS